MPTIQPVNNTLSQPFIHLRSGCLAGCMFYGVDIWLGECFKEWMVDYVNVLRSGWLTMCMFYGVDGWLCECFIGGWLTMWMFYRVNGWPGECFTEWMVDWKNVCKVNQPHPTIYPISPSSIYLTIHPPILWEHYIQSAALLDNAVHVGRLLKYRSIKGSINGKNIKNWN